MVNTPAKRIIRFSRQELMDRGQSSGKLGNSNLLESLNNMTPKAGIGVTGSVLPPPGEYGAQFIHMEVEDLSTSYKFYVTMIYAFNDVHERKELWAKLSALNRSFKGPWVICGSFNTVLVPSERLGGQSTFEEMDDFQQCVNECGVSDCSAIGSFYTWTNKQEPASRVFSRLDRMLVNDEWLKDNSLAYAHFYSEGVFDHTPCVVQAQFDKEKTRRAFKYYNMWSQALEFKDCVQHTWSQVVHGTLIFQVVRKLKVLKWSLKKLNKENFDDVVNNKTRASMNLEFIQHKLRDDPLNPELLNQEREALESFKFLEKACAAYLLQKSKAIWVDMGDDNTKYFHNIIKGRQSRNKVIRIENLKGQCCDDPKLIQEAFLEFYEQLLGTSEPVLKVSSSVVQMGKGLSEVLPDVISVNQGGFVKGRSIVENILICQDIVRLNNRKAISPRFLLKVDLKKAYDSVSWEFLEQMLGALNFPAQFISLLMECVRSASYSLVLNGDIFGFFMGKKGLRQGDPLSPLLFTIAMEYLSRVLAFVTEHIPFKYHPMCGKLKLSHLMFADDLLLFSKRDVGFIMVLLRAFATFSKASGLQMSPYKTSAYFRRVPGWVKEDILLVSGFQEGELPFKYLGVPITAGRLTKTQGQILVEKMSIFIIPKGVLRRINTLCRNFLWDGKVEFMRVPLVSWDSVFSPKEEGGLGIKNSSVWNVAAVEKLVWWVYCSPDKLWVQWVNQIYLKNKSWHDYNPRGDVSWGWKNVCRAKDKLSSGFSHGTWSLDSRGYSICSGYDLLRTRSQDDLCLLCGNASESHQHLFEECVYSKRILMGMADLCKMSLPGGDILQGIWLQRWSQVQKSVLICSFMACYYFIWKQLNRVRCEQILVHPDIVCNHIHQASQSESLHGVLNVRDILISRLGGIHEAQSALKSCGASDRFYVGKAYNLLRLKERPTLCFKVVKSCLLLPRFKVILQLALQKKLATTDLLNKRGWCLVNRCYLSARPACKSLQHEAKESLENSLVWVIVWSLISCLWRERNRRVFDSREQEACSITWEIQVLTCFILLNKSQNTVQDAIIEAFNM
ncbi:uncharacterized protein LOC141656897 [Silene latifolia]|uniref:uncharacterized protein LOC141656897 n=1 Tax=Silene latifolia TaxID=37657 RepID=UPI003D777D7E